MSGITGMFGLGGNTNNASFQAAAPNLLQPTNQQQIDQAYQQSQQGIQQQQAFLDALASQQGIQNQSNVFQQQQALANQLQGVANGTGPNPAQAALNQSTGQNIAQQAALMAGQRGAGANAGLIARQIGQQGAGIQQQAAGQSATMQAQQQLAGMQALQQQQQQLANLSTNQVGQQAGALQGYNAAAQGQQGNLLSALGGYNNANVAATGSQNAANAHIAGMNANNQAGLIKGLGSAVGTAIGLADGGVVNNPQSYYTNYFNNYASGGVIKGEGYANNLEPVPGQAKVAGDSSKNDTVPAMLSPGEVIIPKSVMESKDPSNMAAKFIEAVMAKQGMKRK